MGIGKIAFSDPSMLFQSSPPHTEMELFLRFRFSYCIFSIIFIYPCIPRQTDLRDCCTKSLVSSTLVHYIFQATIAPPVKGKMFKGLCVCYAVVVTTFYSVAISGYWAFGNQAQATVLSNFLVDGKPLLPTWVLLVTNVFTLLQVAAVASVRSFA